MATIEPVAGAGFAMSLAYLALDRFRYRSAVENTAKKALEKYDKEGDGIPDLPDSLNNNETVNELKWLCRKDCNGYSPKGWQITLYQYVFRQHHDVILVIALGIIATFTLVSGVAFSLNRWQWFAGANSPTSVAFFFYLCFASLCTPPLLIWGGRYLTIWGVKRVNELDMQIAGIMKFSASRTIAPVIPPKSKPKATAP